MIFNILPRPWIGREAYLCHMKCFRTLGTVACTGLILATLLIAACSKDEQKGELPTVGFTYQVLDPGKPPAAVRFINNSTNATEYFWFFFPGSNSEEANPTANFRASGTFNVQLTATNANGFSTITQPVVIPELAYLARFSAQIPSPVTTPVEVKFTDQSIGTPIRYFWDFGNGTTSEAANPSVTYTNYGDYTVRQVISFTQGVDSSKFVVRLRP